MPNTFFPSLKRFAYSGLFLLTALFTLAMQTNPDPGLDIPTTILPLLWTAGGLDAGNTGAGQAAHMATDPAGNVAVVSAPALATGLAVTSYTPNGDFRWRGIVTPTSGTFQADWVDAAANGDVIAVGHNVNANGNPIAITMVRYATDGTQLWRLDLNRTLPSVGRLLVDGVGNVYLAFNALGDGQDIELHKYNPSGGLVWAQGIATIQFANDLATSLALSPDETEIVLTGDNSGGAVWITASYNTATGAQNWLVTAPEGIAALDVVVDDSNVYVTGQGNVGIQTYLSVVAYDRASGTKVWRTDTRPADSTGGAGVRISKAPDGSLAVTGYASRGFLDWYTVAFETTGAIRWSEVRDGGLNTDEIPRGVLVLEDGTTVVTGRGGPALPGGFIQGVTAGYSPNGSLLWEAFAAQETRWLTTLPEGNICATGGYDALITCWDLVGVPQTTNTTFLSPSANAPQTTNAGDNNGFQSRTGNAYKNDLSFAVDTNSGTNTNTSCTNSGKDKHTFSNYNFTLPINAQVQGLEVRLDARTDATAGNPHMCVELSWDGGVTWTAAKSTLPLTPSEVTYFLGNTTDTWGHTWTSSDFNNENFRLRITNVASNSSRDFYLEYLAVNVTYLP